MLDDKNIDIVGEIREAESGIGERISREAEHLGKMIEYNARGAFDVFWPTLLAVLVGGYIVKHWL